MRAINCEYIEMFLLIEISRTCSQDGGVGRCTVPPVPLIPPDGIQCGVHELYHKIGSYLLGIQAHGEFETGRGEGPEGSMEVGEPLQE